jgi:hypothetical protein
MKTEEDEAFDELARKQGAWGGGFPAKRKMAADKLHWSDCAVHNGPAYPAGKCDCGVTQEPAQEPVAWVCEGCASDEKHAIDYWQEDVDDIPIGTLLYAAPPQPAQEPVAWTTMPNAADWNFVSGNKDPNGKLDGKWVPLYTAPPLPAQPAQEPEMLTIAYQSGYYDGKQAALAGREWNFCERCGKRTADKTVIHTCTPPQ